MQHYNPGSRHEAVKKAWVTRKANARLHHVTSAVTKHNTEHASVVNARRARQAGINADVRKYNASYAEYRKKIHAYDPNRNPSPTTIPEGYTAKRRPDGTISELIPKPTAKTILKAAQREQHFNTPLDQRRPVSSSTVKSKVVKKAKRGLK